MTPWARRTRRGNQAIEFAIAVPLLLLMFSGVIDLSEALMAHDALVSATSEGSRAGSIIDPARADRVAVAQVVAGQAYTAAARPSPATFTAAVTGADPNKVIAVTGTMNFTPLIGLFPMPAALTYTSTTRTTFQN